MELEVLNLLKIHFSFIIIAGGQLILFGSVLKSTDDINIELLDGTTRFSWFMSKILGFCELVLFAIVFILTYCIAYRLIPLDSDPLSAGFLRSPTNYHFSYVNTILAIIIIQLLARINLGFLKRVRKRNALTMALS